MGLAAVPGLARRPAISATRIAGMARPRRSAELSHSASRSGAGPDRADCFPTFSKGLRLQPRPLGGQVSARVSQVGAMSEDILLRPRRTSGWRLNLRVMLTARLQRSASPLLPSRSHLLRPPETDIRRCGIVPWPSAREILVPDEEAATQWTSTGAGCDLCSLPRQARASIPRHRRSIAAKLRRERGLRPRACAV